MATETEAGMISVTLAKSLLLIEDERELTRLERDGFIKKVGKDSYRLADLIRGFARWAREQSKLTDAETLAAVFGVTRMRITQLAQQGVIKHSAKKGRFDWIDAVGNYVRFLRGEDRRSTKSAADSRRRDAQAHDIEVRTMQRLGMLMATDDAIEVVDEIVGLVRSEFAGLAAASTRDLTMRRIIEREVNARFNRIAERAMEKARTLEASRTRSDGVAPDGAGRMGGVQ